MTNVPAITEYGDIYLKNVEHAFEEPLLTLIKLLQEEIGRDRPANWDAIRHVTGIMARFAHYAAEAATPPNLFTPGVVMKSKSDKAHLALAEAIYGEEWQTNLARYLGVHRSSVRRWLQGQPMRSEYREKILDLAVKRVMYLTAGVENIAPGAFVKGYLKEIKSDD